MILLQLLVTKFFWCPQLFAAQNVHSYLVTVVVAAAFIRVVGSEFVQKYLGEGPRMVRDVFRLAKENAPAIIFIDEIDAIATKRFDAQTGGDHLKLILLGSHASLKVLEFFSYKFKAFESP